MNSEMLRQLVLPVKPDKACICKSVSRLYMHDRPVLGRSAQRSVRTMSEGWTERLRGRGERGYPFRCRDLASESKRGNEHDLASVAFWAGTALAEAAVRQPGTHAPSMVMAPR